MADLRQILSQGRKRIGLLVGAGAPMSIRLKNGKIDPSGIPLIPGADELTSIAMQGLSKKEFREAAKTIQKELGTKANIESILSKVRLLQNAIGNATVHGLTADGYLLLGQEICNRIGAIVQAELPDDRNAYNEIVAWISGTLRPHSIEIFTTNYDLLFEEAFEKSRVPYFDGFSGGASPFFDPVTVAGDDLPARWARLWKLHGSLGWSLENKNIVRGRGRKAAEMIYPDHLKYDQTQKQPYSALFERLKQFLSYPDTLLLGAGFSFRDAHVCAVIEEALAMNANASVFAFQFGKLADEEPACKMAYNRPNLSVYAADGAIINGVEGMWVPGQPMKNWENIRSTYWGAPTENTAPNFLLGDFKHFSRFCALAQSVDLEPDAASSSPKAAGESQTT